MIALIMLLCIVAFVAATGCAALLQRVVANVRLNNEAIKSLQQQRDHQASINSIRIARALDGAMDLDPTPQLVKPEPEPERVRPDVMPRREDFHTSKEYVLACDDYIMGLRRPA